MDKLNDLELILSHGGRVFGLARDYDHGQQIPSHVHAHGQLLFALSGIVVAETPRRLWAIPSARTLWIPPGVRHGFATHGCTRVRTVYVPEDAAKLMPTAPAALAVTPLARALLERAAAAAAESPLTEFARQAVSLLLEELRAGAGSDGSLSLTLPADPQALAFTRYVTAHPDDRTPLATLSRRFGMSAKTLSRRMLADTGLAPDAWRQRARLLEALARIELGDSIAGVAADIGYATPSSFGAAFRRAFGVSPAKARHLRPARPRR